MKKKNTIQLNTIDLGGNVKGCNCKELDLSDYAKKEYVEKAISDAITKTLSKEV